MKYEINKKRRSPFFNYLVFRWDETATVFQLFGIPLRWDEYRSLWYPLRWDVFLVNIEMRCLPKVMLSQWRWDDLLFMGVWRLFDPFLKSTKIGCLAFIWFLPSYGMYGLYYHNTLSFLRMSINYYWQFIINQKFFLLWIEMVLVKIILYSLNKERLHLTYPNFPPPFACVSQNRYYSIMYNVHRIRKCYTTPKN